MKDNATNEDKLTRILRRIARIWSMVIIALVIVILVGEILEAAATDPQAYPWFENLIPLTVLTAVLGLALAWRWEGVGAVITIVSVLMNLGVYIATGRGAVLVVMAILTPLAIPGVLFLICALRSKRNPDPLSA